MKNILLKTSIMLLFAFATTQLKAQSKIITDTITIYGNCGECKARIEDAAFQKGVKSAIWDKKTHLLTVIYNADKTTLEKISIAIAKVGHDNRFKLAADKTYNKLPSCCAYRTGGCHHE